MWRVMMQRIGPYEILTLLGSGGMGEVYRAHDTRLGRQVAIKILPSIFMLDPDRLARFEREARVLASLNHPHIGAIYGVEETGVPGGARSRALVLELIEGETLAEYIAGNSSAAGGVPLAAAIAISRQIADGLDAAHERGVIHRDLKPANIKITPAGTVKILDFGLAVVGEPGAGSPEHDPTGITVPGGIVGTPAYMSPEQARGQAVDKRTDIWAFGCVLYELLCGRQPFAGATISDTIAAILTCEPDWSALPDATPPALTRLLRRCLAKNPRERLRDIGDARFDAEPLAVPAAIAAPASPAREVQFKRLADFDGVKETPAISPDGTMVVFVTLVDKRRQIYLQRLAGGTPLQITHDDVDHEHPRWAPDSDTLIYYASSPVAGEPGMLYEMPTLGGSARPIVAAAGGGDISHAGDRLAFFVDHGSRRALVTASRQGLDVKYVTETQPWQTTPPRWSPDDRSLAFHLSVVSRFDERLCTVAADGGEPRSIARAGSVKGICWLPDGGGLIYSSSSGSTVPYPPTLNLRRAAGDGSSDTQVTFGDDSYVDPDVHASGKLLACRTRASSDIWRFPVEGLPASNMRGATRVTRQTGQVQTPSAGPDGRELVYLSDHGGHGNLWIAGVDGGGLRQLTFERDPDVAIGAPVWGPASNRIVFVVNRGGAELWIVNTGGHGLRQVVAGGFAASWSRDGEWLYYVIGEDAPTWRIEKVHVDRGERVVVRDDGNAHAPIEGGDAIFHARRTQKGSVWEWEICRTPLAGGQTSAIARIDPSRVPSSVQFVQGALSPDGRWIALPLIDGATTNLWILPTGGGPMQPVTDFGHRSTLITRQVSWSPDGRFIYAAVAETTTDVVLLDGLLDRRAAGA
ncbi:MAG TPA: protein kinase [Vicinamibacterales bacterium]